MSEEMQARRSERPPNTSETITQAPNEFIEIHNQNQGRISQLMNGKISFGEKAARKFEAMLGLPEGYFDREPPNVTVIEKQVRQVPLVSFVAAGAFENIRSWTWIPTSHVHKIVVIRLFCVTG